MHFTWQLGEYQVARRIVDVESVVDWYYIRKVTEKGGMYCGGCKSQWHEGVVRYKVIVRVADESGDAPILIWDRECAELVGVSTGDLRLSTLRCVVVIFQLLLSSNFNLSVDCVCFVLSFVGE